ncbi:efflux RND transporter periplasmic adaptor subunit [Flavobacterium psychrotolerans]|uniref:Efflux RND transporter periplasmic adaptor subunit n=1 Tax=Flavobacterium psychrotolerans TaxID=2169410 RepID=A0A2U1JH66_9FLAO|nr:efflux RND transporter periplasmic adaptor subunit [Flavobacterium psychrotolerans]PWA04344.1 efflux RND transporter periplasmic adaptor subunit [Flavobacterium psychrotolerans]
MKKRTIIIVFVLVVLATAAVYYLIVQKKTPEISFITSRASYGFIAKSITATGTIQPVDTVSVGAQVSGVIKNIYVDFNGEVKKGQLLAKIDPSNILAQTEVAKANLATANSNLNFQQNNFDRQNKLFTLGIISKADYQLALNQFNSAKAAVDNALAQLKITIKNLSYTNIYSPINGVILNRNVSEGQTIASSFNAPTLFVIAKDLTKMQVRAAVDEADIGGVQSGQRVTFTVDAFPNDVFQGKVQKILLHPSVSANVVTYKTLIDVENEAMKLKPGMTASIYIYTEQHDKALLIASRALNFKPDSILSSQYTIMKAEKNAFTNKNKQNGYENTANQSAFVWIKAGETLKEKRITIGINDDTNVYVMKGLSLNEEVISNVIEGNEINADNAQRSPFMPKMQRRPSGTSRN